MMTRSQRQRLREERSSSRSRSSSANKHTNLENDPQPINQILPELEESLNFELLKLQHQNPKLRFNFTRSSKIKGGRVTKGKELSTF